ISRNRKSLIEDLPSTFWRRISVLPWRSERARHRRSSALEFAFSGTQLFPRTIEKLIARRNFIDQPELQSFLSRIKFPFQNHVSIFFGPNQAGHARATAPRGN